MTHTGIRFAASRRPLPRGCAEEISGNCPAVGSLPSISRRPEFRIVRAAARLAEAGQPLAVAAPWIAGHGGSGPWRPRRSAPVTRHEHECCRPSTAPRVTCCFALRTPAQFAGRRRRSEPPIFGPGARRRSCRAWRGLRSRVPIVANAVLVSSSIDLFAAGLLLVHCCPGG
jgi:hypothetical protein